MIKKTAVLLVLGLVISLNPGAVFAVESVTPTVGTVSSGSETTTVSPTDVSPPVSVAVPVKENNGEDGLRFVGLQIAWLNVSETVNKLLARTEEQKAEVELRYADKIEKLKERIANSEDPSKFTALLKRLEKKQRERLKKIDSRIDKLGDRKDAFRLRLEQWEAKKKLMEEAGEKRKNQFRGTDDPAGTEVSPTNNPAMRGGNIRIDKPTTNRVEVR